MRPTRLTGLALLVAGCAASAVPTQAPEPAAPASAEAQSPVRTVQAQAPWGSLVLVQLGDQLEPMDAREVRLRGVYRQTDVRKRVDDANPVYRGHVLLELADGHVVFVEPPWSDDAIRPTREIDEYEGQLVELRGTLHHRCPGPPAPAAAAIISPCVTGVASLQPAGIGDDCTPITDEAKACTRSGKTWGRYADPYCGGARPDPAQERMRVEQEMSTCRCYSPDQLRERAKGCARRP